MTGIQAFTGETVEVPAPKPLIHEALASVQADIHAVGKGDWNDFHKFKFRGIDSILNAVAPALQQHRVVVVPKVTKFESRETESDKGKKQREVTIWVRYRFIGPAGDHLDALVPAEGLDLSDKAVAKAMSVAQRTVFIQVFSIRTGDADPDSAKSAGRGISGPLLEARMVLKNIADSKGKDIAWVTQEFYTWSTGGDMMQADANVLKEFARFLDPSVEPTRRVRRGDAPS